MKLLLALLTLSILAALDGPWEPQEPQAVVLVGPAEIIDSRPPADLIAAQAAQAEPARVGPVGGSEYAQSLAALGDSTALLWEVETGGGE